MQGDSCALFGYGLWLELRLVSRQERECGCSSPGKQNGSKLQVQNQLDHVLQVVRLSQFNHTLLYIEVIIGAAIND